MKIFKFCVALIALYFVWHLMRLGERKIKELVEAGYIEVEVREVSYERTR